jgi:hypothetical protein
MTRTRRLVLLSATLLAVAGCSNQPVGALPKDQAASGPVAATTSASPTPSATSSPSPSRTPSPTVAVPSTDKQACDLNHAMQQRHNDLDYTGEGKTIAQIQKLAGNSANLDIKAAANMLKDRYNLAKASHAFADVVNLGTASIKLETACIQARLT